MTALDLYSEPYRPEGNIDARAARRALGHPPQLGEWALFLRETLQNSWDARASETRPVTFRVDAWWPDDDQSSALLDEVFAEMPPAKALGDTPKLAGLPVLVVTDYGTRGLGGPTRADLAEQESSDFVDFIRNVGRAEDKQLGGGTYGFGKGVLYDSSVCSTIVVFTRTLVAGKPASRLMAVRLGGSYENRRTRFTGRHWWGLSSDVTGAEPVTGRVAEALAKRLGLTFIPEGETGTSIMVVGPVAWTEEQTLEEIVEQIAQAALWWAWPHMVSSRGKPRGSMEFAFTHEGVQVNVPDPAVHPVLKHYVDAYLRSVALIAGKAPEAGWPWEDQELNAFRGSGRRLGCLSYRRLLPDQMHESSDEREPAASSHVALMRGPRFVVKYLDVPVDDRGMGTAGVFIVDPTLDREFALSEPVAHDDWVPVNVPREKFQRNHVKLALEQLRRVLRPAPAEPGAVQGGQAFSGLVAVANRLGGLLEGQPGGDARIPFPGGMSSQRSGLAGESSGGAAGRPGGNGESGAAGSGEAGSGAAGSGGSRNSRARRATARVEGRPVLGLDVGGAPVAKFPVRVSVAEGSTATIEAEARVVVDGGSEKPTSAPVGAEVPVVLGWTRAEPSGVPSGGDVLQVTAADELVWAWITQPEDAAVSVLVSIRGSA